MKFCVQCGQQNASEEPGRPRCFACFTAWKDSGGTRKVLGDVIRGPGGIKTQSTTWLGAPLFCRHCGKKLDQQSPRFRHALQHGKDPTTCDDCAWKRKFTQPNKT